MYRQDPMEVLINAKGISADETTWKGAAILSCLGSTQELWINRKECVRALRKLISKYLF